MTIITAAEARPGDVVLDESEKVWQRGSELYFWATFDGPVGFYGPWDPSYGPQGPLFLLVRGGRRV